MINISMKRIFFYYSFIFQSGNCWSSSTLHRATVVGQRTYERACQRKVEWPIQRPPQKLVQDREEPFEYTSLDEAFASILKCMSETTKQCKKYYRSNPPADTQGFEQRHCNRFHTSRIHNCNTVLKKNVQQVRQTDVRPCTQAKVHTTYTVDCVDDEKMRRQTRQLYTSFEKYTF